MRAQRHLQPRDLRIDARLRDPRQREQRNHTDDG
jgi:hypothetical protein